MDPETRDELDQTIAAIAAQTGAVLHTYPRPGRAVRRVVLRDIRDERGTQFEAAQMEDDGTLRVVGHDTGPGVSDVFGAAITSYEWVYVVLPTGSGRWPRRWALSQTMTCSTPWPVTTSSTAAGSAGCCAAPGSLRSSITGPAEPPPSSTAGHDPSSRLCRRGGDHRSRESGRHARVNILAVTVITDWRGSGRIAGRYRSRRPRLRHGRMKLMSYRFSGGLSPRSTYLEKALAAQLTRIDAAGRLFSILLTHITSVPECAVSSVGLLWGFGPVSPSCGVSVGFIETPGWPGRSLHGVLRYPDFRILGSIYLRRAVSVQVLPAPWLSWAAICFSAKPILNLVVFLLAEQREHPCAGSTAGPVR